VQSHCRLDLTAPMPGCAENYRRHLLFEGDLKLKEGNASKVITRYFPRCHSLALPIKIATLEAHSPYLRGS